MRVEIKINGQLYIKAETELEAYALDRWWIENMEDSSKEKKAINLCLSLSIPEKNEYKSMYEQMRDPLVIEEIKKDLENGIK